MSTDRRLTKKEVAEFNGYKLQVHEKTIDSILLLLMRDEVSFSKKRKLELIREYIYSGYTCINEIQEYYK